MTDFQAVGQQFITHYFNSLQTNKAALASLYTEQSMLSYEGEQFMGVQAIGEKLGALPNLTFDAQNAVMDYQPSVNNGIFVLIAGNLFIDGNQEQPLKFT